MFFEAKGQEWVNVDQQLLQHTQNFETTHQIKHTYQCAEVHITNTVVNEIQQTNRSIFLTFIAHLSLFTNMIVLVD